MTDVMSILFVQANILIPIFRRMSFYIVKEIVGYKEDKEIQEMLKQKYIVSNPIEKLYMGIIKKGVKISKRSQKM